MAFASSMNHTLECAAISITSVTCGDLPSGFNLLLAESEVRGALYHERKYISCQSGGISACLRSQPEHPD
jgi:hypothetical protein